LGLLKTGDTSGEMALMTDDTMLADEANAANVETGAQGFIGGIQNEG